jgi:hypothetical protein
MSRITFISFIIIIFCAATACKKSNNSSDSPIVGLWELRTVRGGFAPDIIYAPGSGHVIKFAAATYQQFENGQMVKSGTYQLAKDSVRTGDPLVSPPHYVIVDMIFYDNEPYGHSIKIDNDKFTFNYGAIVTDGIEKIYQKQ